MSDSNQPTRSPWGVSDALSQVRDYHDEAALSRAWNRLEGRRRRSLGPGPVYRTATAAALLAAGALFGIFFERQRAEIPAPTAVSSEVIGVPGPAGPSDPDVSRSAPRRAQQDGLNHTRRNRGLVNRRLLVSDQDDTDEAVDEEALEPVAVEIEEVALPPKATWLVLAERGDFAAAFQALDESGGFDAVLVSGTPEELMTLVEVARFVGRNGRAIQALRAVTTRYESDPNAPIAAMILGNLLSKAGDAGGAAEAYALNRRLSPGGDFAEDALVREFDMAMADGDLPGVQRLRAQYEAEFPEGRHLEEIRAEAARLAQLLPQSSPSHGEGKSGSDKGRRDSNHSSESGSGDKQDGPPALGSLTISTIAKTFARITEATLRLFRLSALIVFVGSTIVAPGWAADRWYVDFEGTDWDKSQVRRAIALELREVEVPGDPSRPGDEFHDVSLRILVERQAGMIEVSLWDRGEFTGRRRVSTSSQSRVLARRVGLAVGELARQLAGQRVRTAYRIEREAAAQAARDLDAAKRARRKDLSLRAGIDSLVLPQGAFLVGPALGIEFNGRFPLRFTPQISWMSGALPGLSEATSGGRAPHWSQLELGLGASYVHQVRERNNFTVGGFVAAGAVHVGGATTVDEISGQRDTWGARGGLRLGYARKVTDEAWLGFDLTAGSSLRRIPMRYDTTTMDLGGGFLGVSFGFALAPRGHDVDARLTPSE